jgi:hypothetical protein
MRKTQAICCLISANASSNLPYFSHRVKCSSCQEEYRVAYPPAELGIVGDYEDKVLAAAQIAIDRDHPPAFSLQEGQHSRYLDIQQIST